MITQNNFIDVLKQLGFTQNAQGEYEFPQYDMKVNLKDKRLHYPSNVLGNNRNTDFNHPENFVVFECVFRLLQKGYKSQDIELEKQWPLGHTSKGGRADIIVYKNKQKNDNVLVILECKTAGEEYRKAKTDTINDGGQLFSYWQQEKSTQWLSLYTSDIIDGKLNYSTETIRCDDDKNFLFLAKKDKNILLYENASTADALFKVWKETYEKQLFQDVIFSDETKAYQIGVKPLRKKDLKDFSQNDRIVNRFEEILRHNNVSDKENAFNRLIALFICKLVDEIEKVDDDEVEFQYKIGSDTYETLQDRLQRLHKEGMEKFMREEIFYVSDNYPKEIIQKYTGQNREKLIEDLTRTIRILKFYSNNDFAFKDVHNEELFYQNGKVLVEVVQLFQHFRIINSNDLQYLGDLFEQLLNKGFKQNEGQFFTPMPITRFMWNALPLKALFDSITRYSYCS